MMRRQKSFPLLFAVTVLLLAGSAAWADKQFGGVGLAVVPTVEGELVVLNVVADSPASEAGLRPGDLLVKIDDFPLRGSDFKEVTTKYLWGKTGASLTLEYLRPGQSGTRKVTLRRVPLDPAAGETPGVRLLNPNGQ
jgi:C-terminal processing protease CtpA/Prc